MADPMASEPLLSRGRDVSTQSSFSSFPPLTPRLRSLRHRLRQHLSSRAKHYIVVGLVALDVSVLLLNIFMKLFACEMHQRKEPWVKQVSAGLEATGLTISCLFMVELLVCLVGFGFSYFKSWFHAFDSAVIVASFTIDVATQGVAAEIGALVVALRLWRLAKLSEEIIVGASERIDDLEERNQELSEEIKDLRDQLGLTHA